MHPLIFSVPNHNFVLVHVYIAVDAKQSIKYWFMVMHFIYCHKMKEVTAVVDNYDPF